MTDIEQGLGQGQGQGTNHSQDEYYGDFDKAEEQGMNNMNNLVNQEQNFSNEEYTSGMNMNIHSSGNQNNLNSNSNNNNYPNNNQNNVIASQQSNAEITTVWELEVWKKSEQTKFKAYLKQIEVEYLNKLADETNNKEDKREKEFKAAINELQLLINKTKKKAIELESRESKISLIEEEIKLKLNEIARQIAAKNEEVQLIAKRSKEEKSSLDKELVSLKKGLQQKQTELEELENNFRVYRKEVDESPISILKMEITRKAVELEEASKEKERLSTENNKYRININKLKEDLISLKRGHEQEKEGLYKQKLEEIEKLKFEIYNQRQSQNELGELAAMKEALTEMRNRENGGKGNNNNIGSSQGQGNKPSKQYRIVTLENTSGGRFSGGNSENYNNQGTGLNVKNVNVKNLREAELERLSNHRSQILNSGAYTENDNLIVEIDNQIRRLIAKQQNLI